MPEGITILLVLSALGLMFLGSVVAEEYISKRLRIRRYYRRIDAAAGGGVKVRYNQDQGRVVFVHPEDWENSPRLEIPTPVGTKMLVRSAAAENVGESWSAVIAGVICLESWIRAWEIPGHVRIYAIRRCFERTEALYVLPRGLRADSDKKARAKIESLQALSTPDQLRDRFRHRQQLHK